MALQGTIKDFGLADIFQLIGIQRKTGVLTLRNGEDTVTVKFLEGRVVGADTKSQSVEDLLGAVLVRTGRITEAHLQDALRTQRKTLQRLGHVLVKSRMISEEDLVEALRVQSLQIVYRLFRWRDGGYQFHTADDLEYDEKHFMPINAETILMEGARMVDEWPIIERRIKSDRMVLGRTEAAEQLELTVESIVDHDIEFNFDSPGAATAKPNEERGITLAADEREVLNLVDGSRTVAEINDRSSLGEFDTFRILADLMTRNLVEEIRRPTAGEAAVQRRRLPERLLQATTTVLVFVAAGAAVATLDRNPVSPWKIGGQSDATEELHRAATKMRLENIEKAVEVFYLQTGSFPTELDLVSRSGYLREPDLLDSRGRPFGYRLSSGGYHVFAVGPSGEPVESLALSHPFTTVQRMMTDPDGGTPPDESP